MSTEEYINYLLNVAKENIDKSTIILLANVEGISINIDDYSDSSVLTEYLSMEEYNELLDSCQKFGFYTLTYFDVNDFIKDFLDNKFLDPKIIVFEGTQRGTSRGRDAIIPSFCDLSFIIHTGPNAYINSLCTNKYHWTKLLENHNILVPKSWRFYKENWLDNRIPPKNIRLIAKPCYECASIGIHKESVNMYTVNYEKYLKKISKIYNQPLIVQEFISGYEVEIPIIISKEKPYILPPVVLYKDMRFAMDDSFLDFDDIYDDNYLFCLLSDINPSWSEKITYEAYKIVELLELERYTRIDFRITHDGKPYVTDINSYPHIVKHSSFAYAFERLNIDPSNILPCIIGNVLYD